MVDIKKLADAYSQESLDMLADYLMEHLAVAYSDFMVEENPARLPVHQGKITAYAEMSRKIRGLKTTAKIIENGGI